MEEEYNQLLNKLDKLGSIYQKICSCEVDILPEVKISLLRKIKSTLNDNFSSNSDPLKNVDTLTTLYQRLSSVNKDNYDAKGCPSLIVQVMHKIESLLEQEIILI